MDLVAIELRVLNVILDILSKICKGHNSKITPTPCNQLILCNCRVKGECPMDSKCQIWTQFMTVMSLHQSHEKSTLGWQKENGSKGILIIKSYLITNDIHIRRHFQVMCGI